MQIQVYLKAPRPGTVKTRLAKTLGNEEACRIYIQLVKRQLSALPPEAEVILYFTPADAAAEIHSAFGEKYLLIPQCEGNLGNRLANGIAKGFDDGAETVCVIGGDCPDLNASHFHQAEALLEAGSDVVYGPTCDGGYYLQALNRFIPELFSNIPWSTDQTLTSSLKVAEYMNLKVSKLEMLNDVDHLADWQQIAHRFK